MRGRRKRRMKGVEIKNEKGGRKNPGEKKKKKTENVKSPISFFFFFARQNFFT